MSVILMGTVFLHDRDYTNGIVSTVIRHNFYRPSGLAQHYYMTRTSMIRRHLTAYCASSLTFKENVLEGNLS